MPKDWNLNTCDHTSKYTMDCEGCESFMINCFPRSTQVPEIVQLRVYVAGPYTPLDCSRHDAIAIAARNTEIAIEAGIEVMKRGHIPFIPHLSHYVHVHKNCPLTIPWYKVDNSFLEEWATALLYLAPSKGADAELELARKLGLRIYYDPLSIPVYKDGTI